MKKSEAVKIIPEASSCHEVQGGVERKEFEFMSDFFERKINHSSTDEMFKVRVTLFALNTLVSASSLSLNGLLNNNMSECKTHVC